MQPKKSRPGRSKKLGLPSSSGPLKRSRAFRFLSDCANLEAEPHSEAADAAYEKLRKRYPEILQSLESPEALLWFGEALRKAWDASTVRAREWYLMQAQSLMHLETASSPDWPPPPPPEPSALEQALLHFRQNIGRALLCRKADCSTPYFIAREKGEKYCSEKCSHLATLATKKRWWDKNRKKGSQSNS
jgi:hypothetical protein